MVQGRGFQDVDVTGEPAVALNESAARALFAGESALGHRLRLPTVPTINGLKPIPAPWHTVVG